MLSQNERLKQLLDQHCDKRVVVLGTTCTGKSMLVGQIHSALDMDEEVFPLLTQEERDFVCQEPWTTTIGAEMIRLTRKYLTVEPSKPLFGTVVLNADVLVLLQISDELLKERTSKRGVSYEDARNMEKQIIEEVQLSGILPICFKLD